MARCLVTGGAGFIGRWVVARLLADGNEVLAVDNLSSGRVENLAEFEGKSGFLGLRKGDVKDEAFVAALIAEQDWDFVFHLAASIQVQGSIDDPGPTFANDAIGTFTVLEACRRRYFARNGLNVADKHFDFDKDVPRLVDRRPRVAVMSTCMVYQASDQPIGENHPYKPASPYAAAKIGADNLALSYFHSYRMPVTVVRPFNTYGPFQRSNSEGGVVSIFLKRDLSGQPLLVKGAGTQTRDLLYVEDCADFVTTAAKTEAAEGEIINAGTGRDVTINQLATACVTGTNTVQHVAHDHPQAEIARLCCDSSKATRVLGWSPRTSLEEGLKRVRSWLTEHPWA